MFISDDNSHHGIKKEDGIDSTFDESMGYRDDIGEDLKSELELSDDSKLGDTPVLSTLVPLEAGNVLIGKLLKADSIYICNYKTFICVSDDIKHKIDQLQQEIEELKERKKQQDLEIANIENINLRERFINLSNNLLTEQLEKEQQVYYTYSFLRVLIAL